MASGCLATGCALIGVFSPNGKPYGFNHVVHAKEGLECGDCHTTWESEDAPGMPARGGCKLCHEAIDEQKPPERRIDVLFDGDTFKARRVSALASEIVFSHRQHAAKPIECKACHTGIEQNEYVDGSLALDMRDCVDCHRQQNVASECSTCHQQLRVDFPPDSHLFQWKKMHGRTVRAHGSGTANDCSLCHTEATCTTCHQSEMPDNHDNYFRRRAHGLLARMDRQNCAACHRSDSCDTCHQETRPMNHMGSFSSTLNTHCLSCHLPVQNSECFTCHRGTPSHDLATPKPPDHTPGMNCRQCHGMGQPLPHVDKGDDCNICHR
ncbi:MAG TPA: cytochrome c3 family protein [Planctomycetota bacterium]|nr:cytochrome c3 family protein [Planctomycetota bacterium]